MTTERKKRVTKKQPDYSPSTNTNTNTNTSSPDESQATGGRGKTQRTEKRVMTSAIPSMTVANVRKSLGEVRKKAEQSNERKPLYLTDVLSNGMKISDFCLQFVKGHHQKRHSKAIMKNSDASFMLASPVTSQS